MSHLQRGRDFPFRSELHLSELAGENSFVSSSQLKVRKKQQKKKETNPKKYSFWKRQNLFKHPK